jgi:hypothetical protein
VIDQLLAFLWQLFAFCAVQTAPKLPGMRHVVISVLAFKHADDVLHGDVLISAFLLELRAINHCIWPVLLPMLTPFSACLSSTGRQR